SNCSRPVWTGVKAPELPRTARPASLGIDWDSTAWLDSRPRNTSSCSAYRAVKKKFTAANTMNPAASNRVVNSILLELAAELAMVKPPSTGFFVRCRQRRFLVPASFRRLQERLAFNQARHIHYLPVFLAALETPRNERRERGQRGA